MNISALFDEVIARQATDLHLVAGQRPAFRCDGALMWSDAPVLTEGEMGEIVLSLLNEDEQARLQNGQDINTPLRHGERLFHLHLFRVGSCFGLAARIIMNQVYTLEQLRYTPDVITTLNTLIRRRSGLLLITGLMGSGKHTLCAALLESVNREVAARIWTLEDSIGFEMSSKQAMITQRIIGRDVVSYEAALQSAEQADVDIIYVSELRSLESVQLALALAETGHTVLAAMSVGSVSEAVQRLVDVFGDQGNTIRRLLANTLHGIIAQRLVRRNEGGRLPLVEVMLNTPRVQQVIRTGQTDLTLAIEAGRMEGMQTMDDALLAAYAAGLISSETVWEQISDPDRMKRLEISRPRL